MDDRLHQQAGVTPVGWTGSGRVFGHLADLATATPEQRAAMQVTRSDKGVSRYVLTLAHDPESLEVRSPLLNRIIYGKDGLPNAERGLGALGASVVNRCIYCAAVHASRFNQLAKTPEVVDAIFADGVDAKLQARPQAILDLAASPPGATAEHVQALRSAGLTELESVDLSSPSRSSAGPIA